MGIFPDLFRARYKPKQYQRQCLLHSLGQSTSDKPLNTFLLSCSPVNPSLLIKQFLCFIHAFFRSAYQQRYIRF